MRLAVGVAALVLLVGCGGRSDSDSPNTRPSEALARTAPDPELLISRPPARGFNLLLAIVEGLGVHMGPDYEREAEVLAKASPGQSAVYALWITDGEVNNGGFEQFFFNSSGAVMDEAIEGAELIGAATNAAILREAADVFSDGDVPENRDARSRILDALSEGEYEELGDLADRWYDHDRQLERRMVAYVRAHPEEFFR
jgi:Domain of unknown function (DUF4375)